MDDPPPYNEAVTVTLDVSRQRECSSLGDKAEATYNALVGRETGWCGWVGGGGFEEYRIVVVICVSAECLQMCMWSVHTGL